LCEQSNHNKQHTRQNREALSRIEVERQRVQYIKVDIVQGWKINGKKTSVDEVKGYIAILWIRKSQ
jgi:hypothetical protein